MRPAPGAHLLFWLSDTTDDLTADDWGDHRPDLVVRLTTAGDSPPHVSGVPVVPVHDLVDGAVTDRALSATLAYMLDVSRCRGANGRALGEVVTESGFPLWWGLDTSVVDRVWLCLRATRTLAAVVERLRPGRVTLYGDNRDHPWMHSALAAALRHEAVSAKCDVAVIAPWIARGARVRGRWAAQGQALQDLWLPSRDGPPDAPVLALEGPSSAFRRAARAEIVQAQLRWRRGYGHGIGIALDDGRRRQSISIGDGVLRLGDGPPVRRDTSAFFEIRLQLDGEVARLSCNGEPIAEAPALPGREPAVTWGHADGDPLLRSEWLEVGWGTRGSTADSEPRRPVSLAPLRGAAPTGPVALPSAYARRPAAGDVVVMSWGWELRAHAEAGAIHLHDPNCEGLLEALGRAGVAASVLCLGPLAPRLRELLDEPDALLSLERFRPASPAYGEAVDELARAWRAWRGDRDTALPPLPDDAGVPLGGLLAGWIEALLPEVASRIQDAAALDAFLDEHRPAALVFPHLASSQRHFLEPLRRRGIAAIAPVIGVDLNEYLFYGLVDGSPCPRPDALLVWGEALRAPLAETVRGTGVFATGRTRQDTFVRRRAVPAAGLAALGLPVAARRAIVFGDVLMSTIKVPILNAATWRRIVEALLSASASEPDVHVVVKPWRGDALSAIRAQAAAVGDPRLHVLDPEMLPYHNADLLAHAVTVVSSPTSLLAEFAAMGGTPVVLGLPETRHYHGDRLTDLCGTFARVCSNLERLEPLVADLLRAPAGDEQPPRRSDEALAWAYGPCDGRSADRAAAVVASLLPSRGVSERR